MLWQTSLNKIFKDKFVEHSLSHCSNKYLWSNNDWRHGSSLVRLKTRYLDKVSGTSKSLNCGKEGGENQHILRRTHNVLVLISRKVFLIFCGTNRLLQNSPKEFPDNIMVFAKTFKSNYNFINVANCGSKLPCNDSWSIDCVFI